MFDNLLDRLNTWSDHIDVRIVIDKLGIRKPGMTYAEAVRELFADMIDAKAELGIINVKYQDLLNSTPPNPDTIAAARDQADPPVSLRERAGTADHEDASQFQLRWACRLCGESYDKHVLNGNMDIICTPRIGQ